MMHCQRNINFNICD